MNQMEIFKNPEFGSIRTFEQDGKVLFCGTDVATALGYANPRKLSDVLENRSERNRWISHFTQFSTMETLDRKAVVHMIQSIKVIGKKELEITFTYQDEYMTAGKLQAFEALMKEVPGHNHYDSGCDGICPECRSCCFHRPYWKYQTCVFEECPYSPVKLSTLRCQPVMEREG